MFDVPPDPIAFELGPLSIGWYGLMYAVGLAVAYLLLVRLARLAGEDPDVVGNGIIIVAVAALIGGRLYHVIDQWELYADDPVTIFLPPYSGLGVYGGIVTGFLAAWWYARRRRVPFDRWVDIIAPALFVMQAIGRWGNYFNQELYGPPTTLPWGIPIDCAHRLAEYPCALYPEATTRFQPLFLYESISGILGAAFLIWLGFNLRSRLRPGDLFLVFLIWYGTTRLVLETFRVENWTFYGIPVAQIFSLGAILVGVGGLLYRHRRGHPANRPPTLPQNARWGALWPEWMTRPIDESWANVPAMAGAAAGAGVAAGAKPDWDAIIDADDDELEGDDIDDEGDGEVEEASDTDDRAGPTG
jgi:phosphatidylglycerol:prolipoprotein diacylglycerol transferase